MTNITEQRARVIKEARTWIGTPFIDNACVKNVGVDCANLLARVYADSGMIDPVKMPQYSPQWFLHKDEERFLDFVRLYGKEIPNEEAQMADVAVYKIGRTYAHGAIVVDWPNSIIHAHKQSRIVLESRAFDGDLWNRDVKTFTLWEV